MRENLRLCNAKAPMGYNVSVGACLIVGKYFLCLWIGDKAKIGYVDSTSGVIYNELEITSEVKQ